MMERGSIAPVNAQARARGMSYGQYVGAVYYPVVIVEVLPDGGEIQRTAAVPEEVTVEPTAVRPDERKGQRKKPVSKKEGRKCVICGGLLSQHQRKYCSDECGRKAAKERYDSAERKPYVSTARREDRACAVCGKLMVQVTGNKKYCSDECGRKAAKERYDSAERKPYVSTARREDRACAVCGKLMVQVTGNKKYCSEECKRLGTRAVQREYRERTAPKQERYCQICGIRIEGAGLKYCGNCAGAVKYEKPEEYWKKYNLKRDEKAKEDGA